MNKKIYGDFQRLEIVKGCLGVLIDSIDWSLSAEFKMQNFSCKESGKSPKNYLSFKSIFFQSILNIITKYYRQ